PPEWKAKREAAAAELAKHTVMIDRALRAIREPIAVAQTPKTQGARIRFILRELHPPDGKTPANLKIKEIRAACEEPFRKRGWRLAGFSTFARIVKEIGRS